MEFITSIGLVFMLAMLYLFVFWRVYMYTTIEDLRASSPMYASFPAFISQLFALSALSDKYLFYVQSLKSSQSRNNG